MNTWFLVELGRSGDVVPPGRAAEAVVAEAVVESEPGVAVPPALSQVIRL